MHVCIVCSEFPPTVGGVGFYVFNLCNSLVKKGHEVSIITRGSWKGSYLKYMKGMNVYKTEFLPLYPFHVQIHGIFTNKLFKSMEHYFDIVHIHYPLPPLIHTSLPIIVTVHTLITYSGLTEHILSLKSLTYKMFSRFIFPFERKILKNASLLTSVSHTVAKELQNFHGFNVNDIAVVGNGVDINFFTPRESNINASYVLYSGRIEYSKGLVDFVKSARYICRECPSTFFILAGNGPFEFQLRKLIKETGLSKNFFLIGEVDRETLRRYYQNASVLVLPSYYESFPNVILEAMACGIPVVTTNVCDMKKIVKKETGLIVPPRNPKALGKAVVKLLKDEGLRKKMGKASRERVKRFYSWNVVSDKILDYYRSVMKNC